MGVVVGTAISLYMVLLTVRIITWIVVAGFFAIVLGPAVRWVQGKLGGRRALATSIVVFSTLAATIGVLALFVLPVRNQLVDIISDLPGTVEDAGRGRGPIGRLVEKLNLADYVKEHEKELSDAADRLSGSSFELLQTALSWLLALASITVITFFFLSQSATVGRAALGLFPARRRESVRRIGAEAGKAISGYMTGNLLISLMAGVTGFIFLVILGVPSPIVLGLFLAFADLIPLVGATIGAAVASLAAFLHSPTAGIAAVVFFVVYQQLENGVIYPSVMSRKVNVNPLVVLLSVLLFAEMFGMLGALLAVPASGAIQVVIKAVRQERQREHLLLPEMSVDGGPVDFG